MALRLVETEPDADYRLVCTPTGNEMPGTYRHLRRVADLTGKPLLPLVAGDLMDEIKREGMIPNARARWCTRRLKIEPFAAYLAKMAREHDRVISCVGIRADEPEREAGDYRAIPNVEQRYPLREWRWGLADVKGYLRDRGVEVPGRTDCAVCFFQRLGEWWDLWKDHPGLYEQGAAIERETGHTFRSPSRDTWPASLDGLRERFEAGHIPKGANVQHDLFAASRCRVCRI